MTVPIQSCLLALTFTTGIIIFAYYVTAFVLFTVLYNCFTDFLGKTHTHTIRRSQWPCGLRHRSAAVRLLGLSVRIPLGAGMCVSSVCCAVR
jgi:hypothetical protein